MADLIRQNVGVDISKKDFKVCFSILEQGQRIRIKGTRSFPNTSKGFDQFMAWVAKKQKTEVELRFTMEATGIYYESLAYFLYELGHCVSVLLPNKAKNFAKSLNAKSKTDEIDAKILAQMGLERNLEKWEPLTPLMKELKTLCRERTMLQQEKTMVMNRLEAEKHAHHSNKGVLKRQTQRIDLLKKQIKEVEKEIELLSQSDEQLYQRIENICTVKGLSTITAITVVAETNGFALFTSRSQLVSYAGYDVVMKQSGTSVLGKTRISKKGNRYIRRALHFPALSAIKHEEEFKNLYSRIFERSRIKMKGVVAVQRKLLVLIYTLFKKNEAYDPNFKNKHNPQKSCRQDTTPAYAG